MLVVVGDDGAHKLGGVPAGAAAQDVHTWRIGVFVLGFCCSALVHQMIPRPRALSQSVRCPVIEGFWDGSVFEPVIARPKQGEPIELVAALDGVCEGEQRAVR